MKITKKLKLKDVPYEITTFGRLVVGHSTERAGRSSSIVAGLFLSDLIQGPCDNFELWDVEVTLRVRRKHKGSPCKGGTIDTQLLCALNEPDRWQENFFDTLRD